MVISKKKVKHVVVKIKKFKAVYKSKVKPKSKKRLVEDIEIPD